MRTTCVFCAIVNGRKSASRVYEDDDTLAFMNLRQANPGHVLIIPKSHVTTIDQLSLAQGSALGQAIVKVSNAIQLTFEPDGLSVWQSNGKVAGQDVFHVHVHILPRQSGDGCLSIYPELPDIETRSTLDALAARLRVSFERG